MQIARRLIVFIAAILVIANSLVTVKLWRQESKKSYGMCFFLLCTISQIEHENKPMFTGCKHLRISPTKPVGKNRNKNKNQRKLKQSYNILNIFACSRLYISFKCVFVCVCI